MNISLKSPFSKATTPTEPRGLSAPAAEDAVKGKQLLRGRTKARVASLRADVETVQLAFKQAERNVGERRAEELDVTAAIEELKQAGDRLRALEAALAFAIDKDDAAQRDLKDAERQASIEVEAAARTRLTALGPRGEEILAAGRQFSTDVALGTDALRLAGGNERYGYSVNEIYGQFNYSWGSPEASTHERPRRGQAILIPTRKWRSTG